MAKRGIDCSQMNIYDLLQERGACGRKIEENSLGFRVYNLQEVIGTVSVIKLLILGRRSGKI